MQTHWNFGGKIHGFDGRHAFMKRFRGFMGGGRGFRAARMLASGDLQLIVLALLQEKPRHGYDIIKELGELSSGIYTPSPGVVYPALTYLEEMGYATAEPEGNKKLYQITDAGKEHLEKNQQIAEDTLEQLSRFGKKMARVQKHFADEEAENDLEHDELHAGAHAQSKDEWRKLKMEFRTLKDELKTAIWEKIDASTEEKNRVMEIVRQAIREIRGK